jgi:hypothetical protein
LRHPKVVADQVGGEALIAICHSLLLQGLLYLDQLFLTLGQVPDEASRDALGLQLASHLPLEIALKRAGLLLGTIALSPSPIVL